MVSDLTQSSQLSFEFNELSSTLQSEQSSSVVLSVGVQSGQEFVLFNDSYIVTISLHDSSLQIIVVDS